MPPAPTRFDGRSWAVVTIVMTLLGWSSVPLFLRHFADSIDFWTSNGWRYGFSALLWAPVLIVGLSRRTLPLGLWRKAMVPSVFNAVSQTLFCWMFYKIDPGLATFGLRSNIVFATIGAAVFFAAERRVIRAPWYIAGLLMVVLGTLGMVLLGQGVPRSTTLQGILLAVGSGAGFAGYALAVRHWMHGVNPIQSFAAIALLSAIPMVAAMLVLGEPSAAGRGGFGGGAALDLIGRPVVLGEGGGTLGIDQFTMLLISAVIGIALGHVFYYYSISRLGLAVSAAVVQLQPFFVSLGSLWLFGETLTGWQWACGGVAVGGAVAILWAQQRMSAAS